MRMHNPPHPGKLVVEFMDGRSVTAMAKHLGVTRAALSRVINGKAGISAEMALRLSEAFGLRAEVWLELQSKRDLWVASRKRRKKVRSVVVSEEQKAA
jgi:addiction module HigA family antidote